MTTPENDSHVFYFFGAASTCVALVMFALPLAAHAQSIEPAPKPVPVQPARPEPVPLPPVRACADPSASIVLTHVLSGNKINVSLAGRICNVGKGDYSVPPYATLHAAYYLDTRYPPAEYGSPNSITQKIHDAVLPNLRAGQCVDVPKAHVLESVVQMGTNPNLRDAKPVAKRYWLRVEINGAPPPKSAANCAPINDASTSNEIVYMELWRFTK
jgi:hypothetical protein